MSQQYRLGQILRDVGRERVETKHELWVIDARREAVRISARNGSVSIVDIRDWATDTNNHPDDPLAYSGVFKGKQWKPTGRTIRCRHEDGHARDVKVWRYVSSVY